MRESGIFFLAFLVGAFCFAALGSDSIVLLPACLGVAVLVSDPKTSRVKAPLALAVILASFAGFFIPRLLFSQAGTGINFPLAEVIASEMLILPPAASLLTRRRADGAHKTGLLVLFLLLGVVGLPFVPLGGGGTCQAGHCYDVYTYGSATWLFVCEGAEYATPPGGVSTGLPGSPVLGFYGPLGDYFFTGCWSV